MTHTALQLSAEELRTYHPRPRRPSVAKATIDEAWRYARWAAGVLQSQFGAQRVVVFGSLVHPDCFHEHSDIDLAVWGIAPNRFYAAAAAVADQGRDLALDLVDAEDCPRLLRERIRSEGVNVLE